MREEGQHIWRPFQEPREQLDEPRWWQSERGEPHLPVEARLVWRDPTRSTIGIGRLVAEAVLLPCESVVGPLDGDFRPLDGPHPEETIAIHRADGLNRREHAQHGVRQLSSAVPCAMCRDGERDERAGGHADGNATDPSHWTGLPRRGGEPSAERFIVE